MAVLQDQVVLVTGAGAGIGRAISLAMAEAGATVAAADIDLAAAQRTADQAAGNARRAIASRPIAVTSRALMRWWRAPSRSSAG
jgi:NAD(P)-dependent dehydrogenase (short-subunit alcohol dehydrogenase family)